MPERKFFQIENGKLKIVVGQTVCKMQIIVARLFLYIWELRLNVGADIIRPPSKDTNIMIEINYINITKLLLFCSGEPCSPASKGTNYMLKQIL